MSRTRILPDTSCWVLTRVSIQLLPDKPVALAEPPIAASGAKAGGASAVNRSGTMPSLRGLIFNTGFMLWSLNSVGVSLGVSCSPLAVSPIWKSVILSITGMAIDSLKVMLRDFPSPSVAVTITSNVPSSVLTPQIRLRLSSHMPSGRPLTE